jgi:AbiTii-like protein
VTARSDRLCREIETGALDRQTPISDVLRKAIALGGRAGSTELRGWATRELQGYGPDDDLPEYRKIAVPLMVDMVNPMWSVKRETISSMHLPEFARDVITNDLGLRQSIGEIEQLAQRCPPGDVVKLQPRDAADLVAYMNAHQNLNGHLQALYWGVSPVVLDGVVDRVRTTLTVMIAELNADLPDGTGTPSAEATTNAINFAVSGGKRNKISFAAPQEGSTVTTAPAEEEPRRWVRTAGAVLLGLVAIAALIFTLMQVQGWQF